MTTETPTLWHIPISHYSEKTRWALDHKGIAYDRRAPFPGVHIPVALWLTRGRCPTLPVLELEGKRIGDSTVIIAALEERFPEPRLYPADAEERRRALELEEVFDEELGPAIRRYAFHQLRQDHELFARLSARMAPRPLARFGRLGGAYGRGYTALRFGAASAAGAERGRAKVEAALDRLEAELDGGDYLVGDAFTVADLTAAALLYPLVLPPEGPLVLDRIPEDYDRFRAGMRARRGFGWVQEMFARHRAPKMGEGTAAAETAGRFGVTS